MKYTNTKINNCLCKKWRFIRAYETEMTKKGEFMLVMVMMSGKYSEKKIKCRWMTFWNMDGTLGSWKIAKK